MSPNNGTLLHGVLRPKRLNNTFGSCSFINLDFFLPHIAYCGNLTADFRLFSCKCHNFIM